MNKKKMVSFIIGTISVICLITILNPIILGLEKDEKSQFDITMEMVSELETLAENYVKENNIKYYSPQEVACIYIRCERYNTGSWEFLAGSKMTKFEEYVTAENPDLASLKKLNELTLPNGETTDFVHMMAAINMYEESYGPLGSWAGDTCQLVTHIKNESGSIEELTKIAKGYFNSKTSLFNDQDVIADLDATNIYYLYSEEPKKRMSDIMNEYLRNINNEDRIIRFVDFKYQLEDFTIDNLRKSIYYDFSKASFVRSLLSSYKVSGKEYENHRYAAVYAFSDYLYENYPYNYSIIIENINKDNTLKLTDKSFKLNYSINKKSNIKDKNMTFSSSNENVIKADGDNFNIVGTGDTTLKIQCASNENIYSEINVTVEDKNSIFTFYEESISIDINNEKEKLPIENNNYDYYRIESCDENIIKVVDDYLVPLSNGNTKILVYNKDNAEIASLLIEVIGNKKAEEDIKTEIPSTITSSSELVSETESIESTESISATEEIKTTNNSETSELESTTREESVIVSETESIKSTESEIIKDNESTESVSMTGDIETTNHSKTSELENSTNEESVAVSITVSETKSNVTLKDSEFTKEDSVNFSTSRKEQSESKKAKQEDEIKTTIDSNKINQESIYSSKSFIDEDNNVQTGDSGIILWVFLSVSILIIFILYIILRKSDKYNH